jgi:general secretion pathway protein K
MIKKGSVLLIVLIIISVTLALSVSLATKNTDTYAKVTTIKNIIQSNIIAYTAAKSVLQVIQEDDNGQDSRDDIWAFPFSYEKDNILVEIAVNPLNAKVNLNNLYSGKEDITERIMQYFDLISEDRDIDISIFHTIKDYIDNDTESSPFGSENSYLLKNGRELNIKNNKLYSLYEISLFADNESYRVINGFFTAAPYEDEKININFASQYIIEYYLPEIESYAEDIVGYRETNIFNDVSELRVATSIPDEIYLKILPYITVKSNDFYVRINIDIYGNLYYYHVLIDREKGIKLFFKGLDENYF